MVSPPVGTFLTKYLWTWPEISSRGFYSLGGTNWNWGGVRGWILIGLVSLRSYHLISMIMRRCDITISQQQQSTKRHNLNVSSPSVLLWQWLRLELRNEFLFISGGSAASPEWKYKNHVNWALEIAGQIIAMVGARVAIIPSVCSHQDSAVHLSLVLVEWLGRDVGQVGWLWLCCWRRWRRSLGRLTIGASLTSASRVPGAARWVPDRIRSVKSSSRQW